MYTARHLTRTTTLVFVMLFITLAALSAQVVPITFHLGNVKAGPATGPWMFDFDDPGLWTDDGSCYSRSDASPNNFAYQNFFTVNGVSTSSCISENLDFVPNTLGFTVVFENFTLTGFHKINTVVPQMDWAIGGVGGDSRQYTGGVGTIYRNGVRVMTVRNCVLDVTTPYPTALQMRATLAALGYGAIPWQQDIGTGVAVTSTGRGVIDANPAFSDPQWVAAFANANGNQVDFVLSTINFVIQNEYGWYNFDLGIKAASEERNCFVQNVNLSAPGITDFSSVGIQMNFSSANGGGQISDLNNVTVNQVINPPTGNIPAMVQQTLPEYWNFSTNLSSFTTDITFDLTGYNLGTTDSWVIMRRPINTDWWIIYGNSTVLDGHTIRANSVNDFSDWTVGSTEPATLPVELSSFDAIVNQSGNVVLNWVSQSETGVAGYRVYRSQVSESADATCLNSVLIPATNTSQQSDYSFTDTENQVYGTWYYWLEGIEFNGTGEFYGPVSVLLTDPNGEDTPTPDIAAQINLTSYPNPFNPNTTVSFYLPKPAQAEVAIYNLKGEKVKQYSAASYATGWHRLTWNGTDSKGNAAASGIYYVKLKTADVIKTHKIVLTK